MPNLPTSFNARWLKRNRLWMQAYLAHQARMAFRVPPRSLRVAIAQDLLRVDVPPRPPQPAQPGGQASPGTGQPADRVPALPQQQQEQRPPGVRRGAPPPRQRATLQPRREMTPAT